MYSLYSAHVMSCHCCMFTENYHFKIFGSKWGRNMMITVISGHLSHAQGKWPDYFLFTNLKGRSNGHVTAATARHHVRRVAPRDCAWNLAKLLSFPDTCNYANSFKWLWKTNQTIDLCKSINATCSSKVFYCELITYSRTLVESLVAFLGNWEVTSYCLLETQKIVLCSVTLQSHQTMWLSLVASLGNTDLAVPKAGAK